MLHRDMKSSNICLVDDFNPRLIDYGQAEYVPDDNASATPGSSTVSLQSKSGEPAFGTPGYCGKSLPGRTGLGYRGVLLV